ncbi:hypothetical protein Patl1_23138 [Pistacia atlantica]|uniref:Uncharacterized protein n=1 Tax=Pistacia atlantica TaxID=434234 RepID=A0ACC0ZZN8_9ROSI|nr:hypothetical protein Patl1_23138 [Pistacia atlantica]
MVGFNLIASLLLMMLVHVTMSCVTLPELGTFTFVPHRYPKTHIRQSMEVIQGPYDTEGSKYACTLPDKLTPGELWTPSVSKGSWTDHRTLLNKLKSRGSLTHAYLAMDKEGYLSKEAVRHCFKPKLDN